MKEDGLSNLAFKLVETRPLHLNGLDLPNSFHHMIDIGCNSGAIG